MMGTQETFLKKKLKNSIITPFATRGRKDEPS
jgi:hypothetical protein